MNPLIRLKRLAPLVVAYSALLPTPKTSGTDLGSVVAGNNTADGTGVLISLTTGLNNSGFGFKALNHDTAGNQNTAAGYGALFQNTGGNQNTANGAQALYSNTVGANNTSVGYQALFKNVTGSDNTAIGANSLGNNNNGNNNTAIGASALFTLSFGGANTAIGVGALEENATGNSNTAIGTNSLVGNVAGSSNTAIGDAALEHAAGSFNIALGYFAGANLITGIGNIYIANVGVADESDTIRIGSGQNRTFIRGIRAVTTGRADGVPVVIDSAGQLGTKSSSARFKKDIRPMDEVSEAVLRLKPVTFHYNNDTAGTPQFGLIAEDVARVNPDLVIRDPDGEPYTVRYDAVNAMLLNEFLKEHRKVQQQEATIAQLNSTFAKQEATIAQQEKDFQATSAQQQKQIEALTAGLQKVSAQLEASKAARQIVASNTQ